MTMFITIVIISAILHPSRTRECVTEEKCEDIRKNANYWKPDEFDVYNDADLIIDGLYLGNVCAAHNETWLKENDIGLIINVAREWKNSGDCTSVKQVSFDLDDSNSEDEDKARQMLGEAALLIRNYLNVKKKGNVLVHCNMGISRSSSVVLRYMQMKYPKRSYQRLLAIVQARRRVIKPNNLFGRILTELDL